MKETKKYLKRHSRCPGCGRLVILPKQIHCCVKCMLEDKYPDDEKVKMIAEYERREKYYR